MNTNRSSDIEMQVSNSANISKRIRYYQGLIDMDKLKLGQHYSTLGDSFIIFIDLFDRFKAGKHIYTFRETCVQCSNIHFNDEATKIFLSTKVTADYVSPDLFSFP